MYADPLPYLLPHEKLKGPSSTAHSCQLKIKRDSVDLGIRHCHYLLFVTDVPALGAIGFRKLTHIKILFFCVILLCMFENDL